MLRSIQKFSNELFDKKFIISNSYSICEYRRVLSIKYVISKGVEISGNNSTEYCNNRVCSGLVILFLL